jgi:hypothetical protein
MVSLRKPLVSGITGPPKELTLFIKHTVLAVEQTTDNKKIGNNKTRIIFFMRNKLVFKGK